MANESLSYLATSYMSYATWLRFFMLAGGVGTIFVATLIIYRICFHPLKRYPGPFLAKITDAYSAFYSYRGTMHLHVQDCHRIYGDTIRYGPNRILTLDPSGMYVVYDNGKPFRKAQSYTTMVPLEGAISSATALDKSLHRTLRKAVTMGFSSSNLKRYEAILHSNFEEYMANLTQTSSQISGGWSDFKDMRGWNQWLALDALAEYGFGVKTKLMARSENRFILDILLMHTAALGVYEQWPRLFRVGLSDWVSRLLPTLPALQKFKQWHSTFIEEAFQLNSKESHGVLGHILQGVEINDGKSRHNRIQAITEGSFMTFTGADSLGHTMSGMQHYLSKYPDAYNKLAVELRGKFEAGERVCSGSELDSCKYLRACLYEVWRLLPPACGVHWRESEEETAIGDWPVPIGTDVGVSHFALFRDERVFRNPEAFWPDRWMDGVLPEEEKLLAKQTMLPFSIGPRSCSGAGVAKFISSLWVANLLVNYDFEMAAAPHEETDDDPEKQLLHFDSHFTLPTWKEGPYIRYRRIAAA